MNSFKTPSHIRSLLKGLSWRLIATSDTILVVLLITCVFSECSIENALKIGVFEFIIKFAIYYFHERVWLKHLGAQASSQRELITKTITWRILATTTTLIVSGIILNSFSHIVMLIAVTELITKSLLYYGHEKIWLKLPIGRLRKLLIKY